MTSHAEHIAVAHIQCDAEEELLLLLKELTDKQMLGGWRLRKHETTPSPPVSPWYMLKDNTQLALLPTHHFAAVTTSDPGLSGERAIAEHNAKVENLYNAINSTYSILYCHLSFKTAVT